MKRAICGGKWKEEVKLQIYRDCFNAIAKNKETGHSLLECLSEYEIEIAPRLGAYVRKTKQEAPYVAHIVKNHVRFSLSDMPFPRWAGWKVISAMAEQIGTEMAEAGMEVQSERAAIGDHGFDANVFNAAMRLPSAKELQAIQGRVTRLEYSQSQHCQVRTEHVTEDAAAQRELPFIFMSASR